MNWWPSFLALCADVFVISDVLENIFFFYTKTWKTPLMFRFWKVWLNVVVQINYSCLQDGKKKTAWKLFGKLHFYVTLQLAWIKLCHSKSSIPRYFGHTVSIRWLMFQCWLSIQNCLTYFFLFFFFWKSIAH